MTSLLERLFERLTGRLPIGWLQLAHSKIRLLAALAGVAFADILIMIQLGFLGALTESIKLPYQQMNADMMISSSDMNTLADSSPVPRQRMYEALATPGVAAAAPLYYAKINWKQPDGTIRGLDTFGIDPTQLTFKNAGINIAREKLFLPDVALLDSKTRNVPKSLFADIAAGKPMSFETHGRTLNIVGTFAMGGGFATDGYLIVSDQTFLKLFPQRVGGAPNHILLKLEPGANRNEVPAELRQRLPDYDTLVRTLDDTIKKDAAFQTTQKPVGLVFGFGLVIGVLVGCIIVYQVLSTDVADHIREYATFKAIGYKQGFFRGIVFEEALILAVFGFIPALLITMVLYYLIASATDLPLVMTVTRALTVFVATICMCAASGAIATQKLAKANPADLF